MKHSWIVLGLLLLLAVSIGCLIYILNYEPFMNTPWLLLIWALIFGILALAGATARAAGWWPRKNRS